MPTAYAYSVSGGPLDAQNCPYNPHLACCVASHYVQRLLDHVNLSTTSRYLATTRHGMHQVFGHYEQRRAEKTGKSCKFVARKEGSAVSLEAPSSTDGNPNSLQ